MTRSGLRRYLLALVSTVVGVGLALAVAPIFNDAPVPLLLAAVLVSAWIGGFGPGVVATGLAAVGLARFFDLSRGSPLPRIEDTVFDLGLFVVVACLISWLIAYLRSINGRLERARSEAEAANRSREQFLTAAAHDLKSPLAGISMTAQRARRQLERLDLTSPVGTSVAGQLADIESSGRHMAVVLDELLDVAQLQAGRTLWLVLQPTRLLDLIETAAAAHQSQTEHHALRIVATADPVGAWDSARLARVVDNLLSNAIKYSPAGGEITLHVSEEDDQAGSRWATVRLRDRGLGIPAADLERVFDSFFRAGNVGVIAGTGIGLAGARQIVEQHGGTLTAESPHGAGSTFVLRLPLAFDSPGRQASHDVALSHEVQDQ